MTDAESAQQGDLLLWSLLPAVGVTMCIPIVECSIQGISQLIKRFKTTSLESQRPELFPPR
ncbi:MAG: hypothetical protein ACTSUU_05025, partial [Candidatus Thorarchaeota archaeon]